jgi:hypothetical protein
VTIPDSFFIRTDGDRVDALIDCVYNYFSASYYCLEYLAARVIVCPTNAVVDAINDWVASIRARMPTALQTYIYHTALHAPTTTLSDQLNCTV